MARKLTREFIAQLLKQYGLIFFEVNTRTNYGMIGNIFYSNREHGTKAVMIFEGCFYVSDENFALNSKTLYLIEQIQMEFKELTRDEKNNIIVDLNGIGDVKEKV